MHFEDKMELDENGPCAAKSLGKCLTEGIIVDAVGGEIAVVAESRSIKTDFIFGRDIVFTADFLTQCRPLFGLEQDIVSCVTETPNLRFLPVVLAVNFVLETAVGDNVVRH